MEQNPNTTKAYKDTVFSSLFYTCDNAVENAKSLYKALTGREVKNAEKCRLEDVIFREFKNDVAYIMDDKLVCFIEHQSTVNPNMPLRMFIYAARTYERKFMSRDLVYTSKLTKIPTPEFYVLYNGKQKLSDDILRLSTSFKADVDEPQLELKVKVIDINYDSIKGTNLGDCRMLSEYAFLVGKVREYGGDIEKAVRYCIRQDILADYLMYYGSEVVNMLFEEYDAEKARKVIMEEAREEGWEMGLEEGRAKGIAEGREKGIAEGRAEGEANMIKRLYQLGNTVKQIASMFKMPESEVEKMLAMG